MTRAFDLAARADHLVKTNPKVGAIILKDGKIISEGYHQVYGQAHAEIHALKNANESVEGATMVVTLEPCSHHGKTPPCALAIQEAGIQNVIIGTLDPNPTVAGQGVKMLKDAGIHVEVLNTQDAQNDLNPAYLKKMKTGTPFIRLKSAISLDGKMALKNGQSQWITGEAARAQVQAYRKHAGAILTGIGTVLADDPRLTVHDDLKASPDRIILDTHLKIPMTSQIVQSAKDVPTHVLTTEDDEEKINGLKSLGVRVSIVSKKKAHLDLDAVWAYLTSLPVHEVLVESGPRLTTALLKAGWVDVWDVMMAPKVLGGDAQNMVGPLNLTELTHALHYRVKDVSQLGDDLWIRFIR